MSNIVANNIHDECNVLCRGGLHYTLVYFQSGDIVEALAAYRAAFAGSPWVNEVVDLLPAKEALPVTDWVKAHPDAVNAEFAREDYRPYLLVQRITKG